MSDAPRANRRAIVLLAVGAGIGLLLAATGLLQTGIGPARAVPANAVAVVNGEIIPTETYRAALSALAQDRRGGADETERKHLLDRMIDEELLLQRALELGLVRDDRRIRNQVIGSMMSAVLAAEDEVDPSDAELRAFYEQERGFFSIPARLKLRQVWCAAGADDADAARRRCQQAVDRLRGGADFAAVKAELSDAEKVPLPADFLPATKLQDYVGPTATRTAFTLEPGMTSDPLRAPDGYRVLQVVERQSQEPPSFETIKPQVLAEFRRRSAEKVLRTYLDDLKQRADIAVTTELP